MYKRFQIDYSDYFQTDSHDDLKKLSCILVYYTNIFFSKRLVRLQSSPYVNSRLKMFGGIFVSLVSLSTTESLIEFSLSFVDLMTDLFLVIWQKVAIKIQDRFDKMWFSYKHVWKTLCTWDLKKCYNSFDSVRNTLSGLLSLI